MPCTIYKKKKTDKRQERNENEERYIYTEPLGLNQVLLRGKDLNLEGDGEETNKQTKNITSCYYVKEQATKGWRRETRRQQK